MIIDPKYKALQEASLEALKYFHKLCTENDIKYSVHGGTMLGAVREKGFIPWDDDVDVSMTRDEFTKFQNMMKRVDLDDGYFVDDNSYTTLHFCKKVQGGALVWITVFVYDYISENRLLQKIKIFLMGIYLIRMNSSEEILNNSKNKGIKGKVKIALEYLIWCMAKFKSQEEGLRRFEAFCMNSLCGGRKFIHRANDVYIKTGAKNVLPKYVMQIYELVPFEDTEVMISSNYNEILISSYGKNYMTPIKDTSREVEHIQVRNKISDNYETSK